ncbi:PREDICTED: ADAM DEC1 [Chrysochloris asiatica]|uniref:ADAM DEC1 n=1 Tax=Chrysochloris asiatica TaxID=185453 RepID=A0A9B0TPF2_CHRAS|nr:PREDICTED: ADAM DEC1 [Chrysochloris asiatica]
MLHETLLPSVFSMSLVLLSVIWLIVQTQAIATKKTTEVKVYEVVRLKKLHILHKRETNNYQAENQGKEGRYEPEVQYQITLNGKEIILHLQKAKHLLGPDYTETYYSPRGEKIITSPQNMENCFYEGNIQNEKNSVASISTCDGLRGYFTYQNQRYMIKPLKSTDQEEHAVFTDNQEELDQANHTCGVRNIGRKQKLIRISRSLNSSAQEDFLQAEKYINLFLVLDNAFYNMYNGNLTLIRRFIFDVMNLLNVMYNTLDVKVILVGMEIWSDGDKIKVVPDAGVTFNNFLSWHRSNLAKAKIHDHSQLLSGIGFSNRRVGLAASNSLCSPSSVAVIEAKKKNNVALVAVMAHELGHVLGMPDIPYYTKCPSGSCVMNQYLSSKFPKDFSTICRSHFQSYLLSQKPKCILQAPTSKNIITTPMCGNKLLEVGEDCDCGSPKECTNSCCEAMTCKLKSRTDCVGDAENQVICHRGQKHRISENNCLTLWWLRMIGGYSYVFGPITRQNSQFGTVERKLDLDSGNANFSLSSANMNISTQKDETSITQQRKRMTGVYLKYSIPFPLQ